MDWLPSDDTPLLDAAIAYASHGFRVLTVWWIREGDRCACGKPECKGLGTSAGKHPIEKSWQKKASSDVDAVRDARRARPHANVGLAMGGVDRLVALDIDGEQGRRSWAELEREVEKAPVTLTSASGRPDGGEHRIFRVPPHLDIKRLGNRASYKKLGIDTRIDNGQIVAAPSVHVSGSRYRWSVRAPIADLPEWLFEALAAPVELGVRRDPPPSVRAPSPATLNGAYVRKALENATHAIASAPSGGRNSLLYSKSCTVFEYHVGEGLDHLEAWRALSDAGRACGLPEAEVSATLSKAWRQAQKQPRRVPPPADAPSSSSSAPASSPPSTSTPSSPPVTAGVPWQATLVKTAEGVVKSTFRNICQILRHADEFRGRLSYNQMRVVPYVDGRPLKDTDFARFREQIEARWGTAPGHENIMRAVSMVAEERSFHPVQDYLTGVKWDGQKRIERVVGEILGNTHVDPLTQRMLRSWFISAVARALSPGCKVDTTLVLVGEQRRKKSTFFKELGGEWFSDSYVDIKSKDGVLQVHAAWIYEWAEIDRVTTKKDSSDVKAFLTVARDDVRPPYGMGIVNQPRSSVIVGTTNKPFLEDETGSRRFWPVKVEKLVDVAKLRAWRDQLWAEATERFRAEEPWWLTEEEERAREHVADEHTVENPWLERIAGFLEMPSSKVTGVTTADVLVRGLGVEMSRVFDRTETTKVGMALRRLGWVARLETRGTARIRVYRPAAQPPSEVDQRLITNSATTSNGSQPDQPDQRVSQKNREENEVAGETAGGFLERGDQVVRVDQPPATAQGEESFSEWLDRQ